MTAILVNEVEFQDAKEIAERVGPLEPDWKEAGYKTPFDAARVLAGDGGAMNDAAAALICQAGGFDAPKVEIAREPLVNDVCSSFELYEYYTCALIPAEGGEDYWEDLRQCGAPVFPPTVNASSAAEALKMVNKQARRDLWGKQYPDDVLIRVANSDDGFDSDSAVLSR